MRNPESRKRKRREKTETDKEGNQRGRWWSELVQVWRPRVRPNAALRSETDSPKGQDGTDKTIGRSPESRDVWIRACHGGRGAEGVNNAWVTCTESRAEPVQGRARADSWEGPVLGRTDAALYRYGDPVASGERRLTSSRGTSFNGETKPAFSQQGDVQALRKRT